MTSAELNNRLGELATVCRLNPLRRGDGREVRGGAAELPPAGSRPVRKTGSVSGGAVTIVSVAEWSGQAAVVVERSKPNTVLAPEDFTGTN